ncbi:EAL domain-containing protein [Paenibacillus puerhi]|uniref:EAL domain-containing protein n=1 Tax=Paenibacillus puerhi TaxID=2692622 RepID=UPI001357C6C0|nr:bifunctional diguanylate cyclase/phosphodiesterase [Paenibacillus puerhi]
MVVEELNAKPLFSEHELHEPFMKAIVNHMDEGIVVYNTAGKPLFYNYAVQRLGLVEGEHDACVYYHSDGQTLLGEEEKPFRRVLAGQRVQGEEIWAVRKGRPVVILQIRGFPVYGERGELLGALMLFEDISNRKWAEQRMEVSEQRYKSLFEHHPDIVCWVDLQGVLIQTNDAARHISGYDPEQLQRRRLSSLIAVEDRTRARDHFHAARQGKSQSYEIRALHRDGRRLDLHVTNIPMYVGGQIVGIYMVAKDVSQEKRTESTAHFLAFHDPLTALPNRRSFHEHLTELLDKARVCGDEVAVMFLDLDRFKLINDTLGHAAGDRLLQLISMRLKQGLHRKYELFRLGGDEFTVVLPSTTCEQAAEVAGQIVRLLSASFPMEDHELHITASIGISMFPCDGDDVDAMIRHADMAMYRAKEYGKNTYQFYTSDLNEISQKKMRLEKELFRALEHDELTLHYQPQCQAGELALTGVEALVRWQHPVEGFIPPSEFIPFAEETGLIVPLGRWVLRTVCARHMQWRQEGCIPVKIAVNLSVRQFQDEGLVELVKEALHESGMEPAYLELEITESIAMINFDYVNTKLTQLKELGVSIAIDDFGTGYSSLSYLKKFSIDKLKIDQSFVRDLTTNEVNYSIVKAIIAMGKSLNVSLIAEGVETEVQMHRLRELGCEHIQGYWYSRPLTAEQLQERFLQRRASSGQRERERLD